MRRNEKKILTALNKNWDTISEFNKGYILGLVEGEAKRVNEKKEVEVKEDE